MVAGSEGWRRSDSSSESDWRSRSVDSVVGGVEPKLMVRRCCVGRGCSAAVESLRDDSRSEGQSIRSA